MRLHHHDDTHQQARHGHRSPLAPGLAIAVGFALALALAGCGVTTVTGPSQGTGGAANVTVTATSRAAPSATALSTATTGAVKPPGGGLVARSCPGPLGSASAAGVPAVVLTPHTNNWAASAHVGDLVQARLPATLQWRLVNTPAQMVLVPPAGVQDDALDMCVWTFRATSPGTAQLDFAGNAVCERAAPCAQLAALADFTVNIS